MIFDFLDMVENYDQRKVENTKIGDIEIDTCAVTDSDEPYETGINSPSYSDSWIIVEMYKDKEEAVKGHKNWVKTMENPPKELRDVGTSTIAKLIKDVQLKEI